VALLAPADSVGASEGATMWQDRYRSKLTSPARAVACVTPGDSVYLGGNAGTPRVLADALAARASDLHDVRVAHVLLLGTDPFGGEGARDSFSHLSFFAGPGDRRAILEGRAEYVPCHLSEIPRLLREGRPPVDVALLMTAPPDRNGLLSLGTEVLASLTAAEVAKRVVVQVNPRMPRVHGNSFLHVDEVHAIVEAQEELPELLSGPPSLEERRIAEHIVGLIPEAATLQLGIGGIPNAVVSQLEDRHDLGIHSEMISDGVMRAYEAGVLSGRKKTMHKGKIVTTFALGSREFYDWIDDSNVVEAHPCDHTNEPFHAARNDRLIAINSAISIDLTGQVNADSIGYRIYSGVGGQVDFGRAARLSAGGRPIIALPSTARGGTVSRIVPRLAAGAGVVTSRADVHTIVTEHGVAELYGRSIAERVRALVNIADPRFRPELEAAVEAVEKGFHHNGAAAKG
jgi:4-hydroxybutyrate CoA-transferase